MFSSLKKIFKGKDSHCQLSEDVCNQCEETYLGKPKTCKGCNNKICKHCFYTEDKVLCIECDDNYTKQMKNIQYGVSNTL